MTPGEEQESSEPRRYALRFTRRALADMDAAHERFLLLSGEAIANAWKDGVFDAVAQLSSVPHRAIITESSNFQHLVRQIIYRRSGSKVAYRVLFTVTEEGEDGPVVTVIALRHGAAHPITLEEAQEIEKDVE